MGSKPHWATRDSSKRSRDGGGLEGRREGARDRQTLYCEVWWLLDSTSLNTSEGVKMS